MKKNLLFAALFMGALTASAQSETLITNKESLEAVGITGEAATVGPLQIISSENVTMSIAYEDSYKQTKIAFQNYDQAIVNGTSVELGWGLTGGTNPSGQALNGAENSTAANAGCVFQFDVKKNGYLTVFGKWSSNKEYYVWAGDAEAAYPIAYTLAMDWSAAGDASHPTIVYSIPSTGEEGQGIVDFEAADIATYINGTKYYWPEKVVLGADAADVKKNGCGAIIFPVYEGISYLVHGAGTKVSTNGAVFTTEPVTSFALVSHDADSGEQTGVLNLIGSTDGINTINAAEANVNAPIFNLAGQQVSKTYKGIVLQNGKKRIQK